jgi:hypothetical protein
MKHLLEVWFAKITSLIQSLQPQAGTSNQEFGRAHGHDKVQGIERMLAQGPMTIGKISKSPE